MKFEENVKPPNYENSLYNLSSSIFHALGSKKGRPLKNYEFNEKIILVLLDGFGEYTMKMGKIDIEHDTITSIFPSTTCTAMTTLITANKPSEHGIIGYLGYDKISGDLINLLDFSNQFLYEEKKVKISRIFKNVEKVKIDDKKLAILIPFFSTNAPIVKYLTEGFYSSSYINIWDGIAQLFKLIENKFDFVFFYVPYIDMVSHYYGPNSIATLNTAREIIENIAKYLNRIDQKYDIVVTADHGQIDVNNVNYIDDELINKAKAPVLGDVRMHMFYFKDNVEYSKNGYKIYKMEEVKDLFGGEGILDKDIHVGIALNKDVYLTEITKEENYLYRGHHSSLLKEEMEIPIINLRKINI